jgi:Short C-terminal domain
MLIVGTARYSSAASRLWVVLWMALLEIIAGCSGVVWHAASTVEGEERYVKVVAPTASGNDFAVSRLAHPIVLPEANWARILGDIYVKPRKRWLTFAETTSVPVFAFNEIDQRYLAHHLAQAFSRVKPSEWVVFYLAHTQPSEVTEVTSGAFFVQQGQLHLLIANYRYAVTVPLLQQQIRDHPLRASGESFFEFVPRSKQTVATEHTWDLPKPLMAEFRELLVEMDEFLPPVENARPVGEPSRFKTTDGPEPVNPFEEQLRTLDRLFSQGLITQEEYKLKRQKLLDKL